MRCNALHGAPRPIHIRIGGAFFPRTIAEAVFVRSYPGEVPPHRLLVSSSQLLPRILRLWLAGRSHLPLSHACGVLAICICILCTSVSSQYRSHLPSPPAPTIILPPFRLFASPSPRLPRPHHLYRLPASSSFARDHQINNTRQPPIRCIPAIPAQTRPIFDPAPSNLDLVCL